MMRSVLSIVLAITVSFSAGPVLAQAFKPAKPIEFVVHTGPGGSADVVARFMATLIEKEQLMPVRLTVANKTGGGGLTAMAYIAENAETRTPSGCSPACGSLIRSCAKRRSLA